MTARMQRPMLDILSQDIIQSILDFMTVSDMLRMCSTSKYMRSLRRKPTVLTKEGEPTWLDDYEFELRVSDEDSTTKPIRIPLTLSTNPNALWFESDDPLYFETPSTWSGMPNAWSTAVDMISLGNLYVTCGNQKARILQLQMWNDVTQTSYTSDRALQYQYDATYSNAWPSVWSSFIRGTSVRCGHWSGSVQIGVIADDDDAKDWKKLWIVSMFRVTESDAAQATWRELRRCVHSTRLRWTPIDEENDTDLDHAEEEADGQQ